MTTDFHTFEAARDIAARPETVLRTWTDPALKKKWFCWDQGGWSHGPYEADLGENGGERVTFENADVGPITYASRILQVRPGRLVYTYTMTTPDGLMSSSQSTVTFTASGGGTRLVYTEQIVFLDGADDLESRLAGTEGLLDRAANAAKDLAHA